MNPPATDLTSDSDAKRRASTTLEPEASKRTRAFEGHTHETHSKFSEENLQAWLQLKIVAGWHNLPREAYIGMKEVALACIVSTVNRESTGAKFKKKYESAEALVELLDNNPMLNQLLEDRDFKGVMTSAVLLDEPDTVQTDRVEYIEYDDRAKAAAKMSWVQPFKGTTQPLFQAISQRMTLAKGEEPYARYATFTQSSGTGKSRMNDELAKSVLYIPINLAAKDADVFPPPDPYARELLLPDSIGFQEDYARTVRSFLHAIFSTTFQRLVSLVKTNNLNLPPSGRERIAALASLFRGKMGEGIEFGQHGHFRTEFYKDVKSAVFSPTIESPAGRIGDRTNLSVADAARQLIRWLDPDDTCTEIPNVILCFDEAHELTMAPKHARWTRFAELRRVLRDIINLPIYTLFLSTVGKLEQFAPLPETDPSARVALRQLSVHSPIVATPLDVLSRPIPEPSTSVAPWTLKQVASTDHMSHLGRPLFPAMYEAGDPSFREDIVRFAIRKLLKINSPTNDDLSEIQLLACLGVRVPFEFKQSPGASLVQRELVTNHLRLLLFADVGFTRAVTACASEPLLAEASYQVGIGQRWLSAGKPATTALQQQSPILVLSRQLQSSYMDLGTRGELVAAVLLLDARDRATMFSRDDSSPALSPSRLPKDGHERFVSSPASSRDLTADGSKRIIGVKQLLDALIGKPEFRDLCLKSWPISYLDEKHEGMRLEDAFADGKIYFNHFVKVHKFDMVNQQYLLLALSRGAALICADNQGGLDIIIPILFGDVLLKEKVSAIMIQVKNSRKYGANVHRDLFESMNPYSCAVFAKGVENPPPVLRMVFALASPISSVKVTHPEPPKRPRRSTATKQGEKTKKQEPEFEEGPPFTAYDIWMAGPSKDTFGVVQNEGEVMALATLLQTMRDQRDVIALHGRTNETVKQAILQMQPLTSTEEDCFINWVTLREPEHREIGREIELEEGGTRTGLGG